MHAHSFYRPHVAFAGAAKKAFAVAFFRELPWREESLLTL